MKKITTSLILLALVLISVFTFTACDETNYTLTNVKDKYTEIVSTYSDGSSNTMFNGNTINVKFKYSDIKFSGNPSNNIAKKFYAFNYYDILLEGIFSYYEYYNENLFSAENQIPTEEINALYSKLNSLQNSLKSFNDAKNSFEGELAVLGFSNPPLNTITIFTYEYNKLVQSSINFIEKFIQVHKIYVYGEQIADSNAVIRMIEEAKFYVSKFVFNENIKAFNNVKGVNGTCDLTALVSEDLKGNNPYVLIKDLEELLDSEYKTGYDFTNFDKLNYFRNCFVQDLKIYEAIYNKFDVYEFAQNKLNANLSADLNAFVATLSSMEQGQYQYIENFRNNTYNSYVVELRKAIQK